MTSYTGSVLGLEPPPEHPDDDYEHEAHDRIERD